MNLAIQSRLVKKVHNLKQSSTCILLCNILYECPLRSGEFYGMRVSMYARMNKY